MEFREATIADIPQMHVVRMVVKENVLSNPGLVTAADYEKYLTTCGKGWLCMINDKVAGFSIVDTERKNVWALFVAPAFEGMGIGKQLQNMLLNWYFGNHEELLWLSTAPGTRAEIFYGKQGWKNEGLVPNGEIKFTMDKIGWKNRTV